MTMIIAPKLSNNNTKKNILIILAVVVFCLLVLVSLCIPLLVLGENTNSFFIYFLTFLLSMGFTTLIVYIVIKFIRKDR